MARRRRKSAKPSDLEALFSAPWWVAGLLAIGALFVVAVVLPAMAAANPLVKIVAGGFTPLGYLAAGLLSVIALVIFFRQSQKPSSVSWTDAPAAVHAGRKEPWPESAPAMDDSVHRETGRLLHGAEGPSQAKPTAWSLELLRSIEWKRFEELTAAYFREKTFRTETLTAGPDGGIDVKLFSPGSTDPFAIVQCKAWNTQQVGVKPVRELLGVMAHEKVKKGIFMATGTFTQEAEAFAKVNPINLVTGEMLLKGILALNQGAQQRLLAVATEGEYQTPSCPSCGVKMVLREGKNGEFWGCANYPTCRHRQSKGK